MSNIDIVPELLEEIQRDFREQFNKNSKVIEIWGNIKSKMATYKEANEFAIECGEMLSNSYSKFITTETLPEGRMWYNIASRILEPTLHTNYSLITDVSNQVQNIFNEKQGIGLKSITPKFNQNKVKGLIDKVSNAEHFEDVEWVLKEPIVNFSQAIVDDAIKSNAQFHYDSGLTPKIIRKAESGCCKWCANLEGEYDYPYVPSDVYRRHERCRCTVEYVEDGKYQNVWTKKTYDQSQFNEERDERIARTLIEVPKEVQLKRIPEVPASIITKMHDEGLISYKLSKQNYDNHFLGTRDFERKKAARQAKGLSPQSVLLISIEEAQDIINKQSGTGILKYNKNGEIIKTEKITCDKVIGMYYDKGAWHKTNKAQIHHSKDGSHLVPIKGNDYD